VTSCEEWDAKPPADRAVINVAFTHPGLLLITEQVVPTATPPGADPKSGHAAFFEGAVARSLRTPAFGDSDASCPANWHSHFLNSHVLVSITAATPSLLGSRLAAAAAAEGAAAASSSTAVTLAGTEIGGRLPNHVEHFGYADGIGQPDVDGIGLPSEPGGGTPIETTAGFGWKPIPPGEFVLGYPNAAGETEGTHPLLRNGSFLVFRKLAQDVAAFRKVGDDFNKKTGLPADWLTDRMVGRHRNGNPIVSVSSTPNDFRYSADPNGFDCPFGAHIRRTNPRDDVTGPSALQVERRRMIRRGLPYGDQLAANTLLDDGAERGLLFLAINADIERQFEFVQASWINSTLSSMRLTIDADRDPLTGANEAGNKFIVQDPLNPWLAFDLKRFVTVRGSAYLFLPSLSALTMLANKTPIMPIWPFYPAT
jgi:Dyp-type peroxidase family